MSDALVVGIRKVSAQGQILIRGELLHLAQLSCGRRVAVCQGSKPNCFVLKQDGTIKDGDKILTFLSFDKKLRLSIRSLIPNAKSYIPYLDIQNGEMVLTVEFF